MMRRIDKYYVGAGRQSLSKRLDYQHLVEITLRYNFNQLQFCIEGKQPLIREILGQRIWLQEVKYAPNANIRWKATSHNLKFNNVQVINHYPNHQEITQKAKMYSNLYNTPVKIYLPETFVIRRLSDLYSFAEHFKGDKYLFKPMNMNRGQGISIFDTIKELKQLSYDKQQFILQKYIVNPYLIDGRKFDFRVWVLLDQNRRVFWCKQGYLRLSSEKFNLNSNDKYIHLTNWAIQKEHRHFGIKESGNQMSFQDFTKREPKFRNILTIFKEIIYSVFEYCYNKIDFYRYKGTYELFGFDFMIDEDLKVYLIEINTNPCIERSSTYLQQLIPRMLNNMFQVVIDQCFRKPSYNSYPLDGFSIDENIWELISNFSQ